MGAQMVGHNVQVIHPKRYNLCDRPASPAKAMPLSDTIQPHNLFTGALLSDAARSTSRFTNTREGMNFNSRCVVSRKAQM